MENTKNKSKKNSNTMQKKNLTKEEFIAGKSLYEAKYYISLKENSAQCILCPRKCIINNNKFGFCNARANINGRLYSVVYGRPVSLNIDPIEKKPLFHFLPATKAFSLGTIGCNLNCLFCQNWEISRAKISIEHIKKLTQSKSIPAEEIVSMALEHGCKTIAYTYNEPTVFFEYMIDIAKEAKKHGIRNIIVSNGFINKDPLNELIRYIDGANIDLKAFNEEFYTKICGARLGDVKRTISMLSNAGVWVEITNLIIPGHNDNLEEIEAMAKWISLLNKNIPLHFSRFFPMYKMKADITPVSTLANAYNIAKKYLNYVYIGNVSRSEFPEGSITYCKSCGKELIAREDYYSIATDYIKEDNKKKKDNARCRFCGETLEGIF